MFLIPNSGYLLSLTLIGSDSIYRIFVGDYRIIDNTALAVRTVDYEDFWEVAINNKGIDLAYVFIESNIDSPPLNLAGVSGC